MKFLLDQDVWAATVRFLRTLGHDVVTVAEIGLAAAADEALLQVATQQERIFVTRDRDYGNLVFVKLLGAGVIYLRILPSNQELAYSQLEQVLTLYSEIELKKAFIVIEPNGYRFRKLSD